MSWQLLIVTDSYCELTVADSYWQLLKFANSVLYLLTVSDSFWQFLTVSTIIDYWKLLEVAEIGQPLSDSLDKCMWLDKQVMILHCPKAAASDCHFVNDGWGQNYQHDLSSICPDLSTGFVKIYYQDLSTISPKVS